MVQTITRFLVGAAAASTSTVCALASSRARSNIEGAGEAAAGLLRAGCRGMGSGGRVAGLCRLPGPAGERAAEHGGGGARGGGAGYAKVSTEEAAE